jgi:hypothetical protein
MLCKGLPLTLKINVDDQFKFELNGMKGSGDKWDNTYSFTIPTTKNECGMKYFIQEIGLLWASSPRIPEGLQASFTQSPAPNAIALSGLSATAAIIW